MNRTQAASETGVRLGTVMADAGVPATDTSGGLKEAIDDALRLMGVGEDDLDDTAAEHDAPTLLVVVRYFALRTVRDRLALRFDISAEGASFRLSQVRSAVEAMLTAAAADVVKLFGSLALSGTAAAEPFVTLDLNYKHHVTLSDEGFA